MGSQQGIAVHWKAPHVFVTSLAQTRRLCGPPGKCCGSNRRIAGQRLQHRNGGDLYSRKRVNPICWPLAMSGAASVQFHCEQHTRTQQAHRGLAINERAHRRRSGLVGEEDAPTWGHFFFFPFFLQIFKKKTEYVSFYTIQTTHVPAHTHVAHLVLIFLKSNYEIFNIIRTMQQNSTHGKSKANINIKR